MLGVFVNTAAILTGGAIGLLVNKGIPKRFSTAILTGVGLCTLYIGISGALQSENPIILVLSIVLGVATGTALRLDDGLNALGVKLEKKFAPTGGNNGNTSLAQGFVTGSLLFCVGAMAVVGSIEGGLRNDYSIIVTKSIIDGVAAMVFASYLGFGVLFSAFAVLIYQGTIEFFAGFLQNILVDSLVIQISAAGGIMILALGVNMTVGTKMKVANFLPGLIFAAVYYVIFLGYAHVQ